MPEKSCMDDVLTSDSLEITTELSPDALRSTQLVLFSDNFYTTVCDAVAHCEHQKSVP